MGMLALVLQPHGLLRLAVEALHADSSPCHVVGIQVRIAAEVLLLCFFEGGGVVRVLVRACLCVCVCVCASAF